VQGGFRKVLQGCLWVAMEGISDATKLEMMETLATDVQNRDEELSLLVKTKGEFPKGGGQPDIGADNLFIFLTENLNDVQECPQESRDTFVRGLLDVYRLQRKKGVLSACDRRYGHAMRGKGAPSRH
jgi:hypothetical protein